MCSDEREIRKYYLFLCYSVLQETFVNSDPLSLLFRLHRKIRMQKFQKYIDLFSPFQAF